MRLSALVLLAIAHLSRAALAQAAESSRLDTPLADAELRRSLDARVTVAPQRHPFQAALHVFTAGDLLAGTTALGYVAAATLTAGEALDSACTLHDGACSGAAAGSVAFGAEVYGALGDSEASLDPLAQAHYAAFIVTVAAAANVMVHVHLARGVLEEEALAGVLVAGEF